MNPIRLLFKSRKFLLLLLDTAITLILFFVGKYAMHALEDVKFVIVALQPVFMTLIYSIAYEDGQARLYMVTRKPLDEVSPIE